MANNSVLYELFGAEGVGQLEKLACEMLQKEAGMAAILQGLKAGAGHVGGAARKGGSPPHGTSHRRKGGKTQGEP